MSTKIDLTKKIKILDEGSQLTPDVNQINFIGAGVTATTSGDDVTVNVSGTPIGGGASISYYLNGGTNQGTFVGNTYYEMSKIPVVGTNADFNINADGYVANFITDAGDPGLLSIPAGNWNFELFFNASSSGGTPSFHVELYKYDGATFTLIATSSATPEGITNGTFIDAYYTSLAVPQTTLTLTDRLAVRVYVLHSGRTITLHTQGSHLCQIVTTFSTGISSLNGLTVQTQTFSTGTTGTDFGISSSGSNHTFNLPTSSATNRGALSATDWSTFNGKVSTGVITGSGLTMNTNKLLGRTTAGLGAVEEINIGTGLTFASGTLSASASSGVWGISDTSGVYTYYATLTLAMAAAAAGQVIELFADVTETGNVTIALKDGVVINGNGHTYNYTNNSGVMFSFTSSTAGNLAFYNINITRTNTSSTGAAIFSFINSSVFINSKIDFSGCVVRYNVTSGNSPVFICDSIHSFTINNLNCITNGGGTAISTASTAGTINNCYIECTGTSGGFSGGIAKQCVIITQSGTGISGSGSTIYECVINCLTSGTGVANTNGAYNCMVVTNTGYCFDGSGLGSQTVYNCIARSTSGVCFYSTVAQNSQAYSTTGNAIALHFNYGDGRYKFYNCFLYSAGAIVSNAGRISLLNCTIISGWNNTGGHAIRMDQNSALNEVANCVIEAVNASANCINSVAASTIKYANNSFKGVTTPINANITQGIVNTQDNQGNILL